MANRTRPYALVKMTERIELPCSTGPIDLGPARRSKILAIGDIHGCFAQAQALVDAHPDAFVVLLGDLTMRGPDSRGSVLFAQQIVAQKRGVLIAANHEEMFLNYALSGDAEFWFSNGGQAVAEQIGIGDPKRYAHRPDRIEAKLGAPIVDMMVRAPDHLRVGQLLFVHAGIHPHVDLQYQINIPFKDRLDCMMRGANSFARWIGQPFLEHPLPFKDDEGREICVIHGHSIWDRDEWRLQNRFRLNLDSGAFETGVLTAALIEGDQAEIWQAEAES